MVAQSTSVPVGSRISPGLLGEAGPAAAAAAAAAAATPARGGLSCTLRRSSMLVCSAPSSSGSPRSPPEIAKGRGPGIGALSQWTVAPRFPTCPGDCGEGGQPRGAARLGDSGGSASPAAAAGTLSEGGAAPPPSLPAARRLGLAGGCDWRPPDSGRGPGMVAQSTSVPAGSRISPGLLGEAGCGCAPSYGRGAGILALSQCTVPPAVLTWAGDSGVAAARGPPGLYHCLPCSKAETTK